MSRIQPAIYARVSSEQQAQAHTIDSQIAALRDRVAKDGLDLSREMEFIDEGYSGSTLCAQLWSGCATWWLLE